LTARAVPVIRYCTIGKCQKKEGKNEKVLDMGKIRVTVYVLFFNEVIGQIKCEYKFNKP
jgi:hypothetical protein